MSQDYSRILFDPQDDYLGVLLQQGRPLMDADWNALVAQLLRRTQAGSFDTFGPAVVPENTPDAFLVMPTAGGFTIGRGRIYVDGILAENHGAGARTWDAHLAEEYRPDALAWNAQPYLPDPVAPPAFPYLVYLDVWQREVTELSEAFEAGQPETRRLIDAAVGVDTTQRLQTIWQVRTLAVAAGTDCATPLDGIAAWTAATAPSAGRLTTSTGVVAGDPDPCLVPPLGGYKGGENQLYRVEVQTGGAPGVATIKWSRDNGSIQARVLAIPDATHIVLDSVGKDGVLRFDDGDWIEITDDVRELTGLPGILRRIATIGGVADATRTLTLTAAIPAGTFPVDAQLHPTDTRNTRIRKWDQSGQIRRADGTNYLDVDAAGGEILIPADGSTLLIENGILVNFTVAAGVGAGEFHAGDYWVFAARTNNASVEILDAAPPRGIHHHYAKLGVVTSAADADDCREHWPPDRGCCTKVVRPGQSIQDAIDSLPPTGGCVCLKTGVHEIDAPLTISKSNVILHGEAPGVRVVTTQQMQNMLVISDIAAVENVEVMHISFEYAQAPDAFDVAAILALFTCRRVRVHDCLLLYTDAPTNIGITGAVISDADDCAIVDCRIDRVTGAVEAGGTVTNLRLCGNVMNGLLTNEGGALIPYAPLGIRLAFNTEALIGDNRISNFMTGVEAFGNRVEVIGNTIRRAAFPAALDTASDADQMLWAVDVHGTLHSRVHGNDIVLNSQSYGGIRAAGRYDDVTRNKIVVDLGRNATYGPIGIFAGDFNVDPTGAGDFATLSGNQLEGPQISLYLRNPQGARVEGNIVTGDERLGVGVVLDTCVGCVVAGNTFDDLTLPFYLSAGARNRILDNTSSKLRFAAFALNETGLDFDGNTFDDATLFGMMVLNPRVSARFANLRLAHCGYAADFAMSLGIIDTTVFDVIDVAIQNCEITDTGVSPDGGTLTAGRALGLTSVLVSHLQISDNRIAHSLSSQLDPAREHRALLLYGVPRILIPLAAGSIDIQYGAAFITGNVFQGPARTSLVEVVKFVITDELDVRFEQLTFSANRCDHQGDGNQRIITADLFGTRMIVTANQVKTPLEKAGTTLTTGPFSFGFGNSQRATATSNHSTRGYVDFTTVIPTPLNAFNVIG